MPDEAQQEILKVLKSIDGQLKSLAASMASLTQAIAGRIQSEDRRQEQQREPRGTD